MNAVHLASELAVKRGVISGRKMTKMASYKEHTNGERPASKRASSSSSVNPDNGDHKLHKRSKKIDHDDHQVEVKMSSTTFMVINADYHVPRSHPPKNN